MNNQVHTFMDIKLVGKIIDYLFKIIGKSKVAVVVYSEKFASSDWCLKELDMILQLMKDGKMMMLPIFYKVNVHELKHLTGNTGNYLDEHVPKHGETNVHKWKTAVTTLGTISGLSYRESSYEHDFITDVIKTVKDMLKEWEEPVGSPPKPHYSGLPSMEPLNNTELDLIIRQRLDEFMSLRLYEKESTGNQQLHVLAIEENTQALGVQTDTFGPRLGVSEEEVVSSNDQQQQADETQIEKDLACDKNIEKDLKVPQEDKRSSTGEEEVYRIVTSAYFQKSAMEVMRELITIMPTYLIFYVEPKIPSSSWLTLTNKTDNNVAFMLKMDTEKQLNYSINPSKGVLLPHSRCQVQVTMEAQAVIPSHEVERSKDTFLIHSVKAKKDSYSTNDISNLFKGMLSRFSIDKYTMRVLYVAPPPGDSSTPKRPLGQLLALEGLHYKCMYVNSIDTHPTKPWLLLAFHKGFVSIWNYETRVEEKSFKFDDWGSGYANFIHKKHWIVVGGNHKGFVLVLNYNTSEKLKEFKAHKDSLRYIKVHPTSPYVLTTSRDKLIKLWNWENDWACSETFEGHSHSVIDVAFNPTDSTSFASASLDGTIKIWSFDSSVAKFTINAHADELTTVEYFVGNDNKLYLLSGSWDNNVRVWDYASKTLVQTLEGHSNVVRKTLVHPKLPIIITCSDDKNIRIWDKDTLRLKRAWTCGLTNVNSIGFIQASDEVVLGCSEGMVVIKIRCEQKTIRTKIKSKTDQDRTKKTKTI